MTHMVYVACCLFRCGASAASADSVACRPFHRADDADYADGANGGAYCPSHRADDAADADNTNTYFILVLDLVLPAWLPLCLVYASGYPGLSVVVTLCSIPPQHLCLYTIFILLTLTRRVGSTGPRVWKPHVTISCWAGHPGAFIGSLASSSHYHQP